MRRLLILLQLLIFLGLAFTLTYAHPTAQSSVGVEAVVTKRARLRAGPGTEWAVLRVVQPGDPFRIDGKASLADGTFWVRGITSDSRIGWIFGDLISVPADQLAALPAVWVDAPFTLSPPAAVVSPGSASGSASVNSAVISGITTHARQIFQQGQSLGNRANVFSKVGDSITASPYFLYPIGQGFYNLRDYSSLQRVVDFFRSGDARDGNNSFANPSLAAYNGITTAGILDPNNAWTQVCSSGETPLECEYRLVRPSIALIMVGTNDVASLSPDDYRNNLSRIVQISIDRGIIPVLSLIPVRGGYEASIPTFNQIIADVAAGYDIPLWNFPALLAGLDNNGLTDGIHPSAPPGIAPDDFTAAADFTPENLRYGYTVRNLTALQVLDAIWRRALV
jgi:hypothetical protein